MPIDITTNTDDSSMFAPIPSWERNRKRRGFGASRVERVTTTTEVPAAMEPLDPVDAPLTSPETAAFVGAPVYARSTATRRSGGAAMAVTAGLVALVGLGAAAFYASRPRDGGLAQLTPGSTSTTTTTVTPGAMALNDAAKPVTPATRASSAVNPAPTRTTITTRRTARATPPASRSVGDAGVNASATLPGGPLPYSGAAVNPAPAPVQTAPAPAPAEARPAPSPAPVESAPAPEASAPATPAAPE